MRYSYKNMVSIIACLLFFCLLVRGNSWANTISLAQLIIKGQEFYHNGDVENAVRSWEQAVNVPDAEKDREYTNTLIYLANAYHDLGDYTKASAAFEKAKPGAEKSEDARCKSLFYSSLGDLCLSLGETEKAIQFLEEGLNHACLTKNPHVLASVWNNKGNALNIKGDYYRKKGLDRQSAKFYKEAKSSYEKSLGFIEESSIKSDLLKSKILINLSRVLSQTDGYQNTIPALDKTMEYIRSMPDSHNKAMSLISFGLLVRTIRQDTGEQADDRLVHLIYQSLTEAAQIAENLRDSYIASYAYGYLGQLYEEKSLYPDAEDLTRRAIFSAQQGTFPEILYLWKWQSGRLFRAKDDIENAVKAYENAISILNPVQMDLLKRYRSRRDIFNEEIRSVYSECAELLLIQAEKIQNDKDRESKLRKARDTMELLKKVELQNYFQDECITTEREKEKKTVELKESPVHTAIIYPILFSDYSVLLLTLPEGMKQIRIPVSSENIKGTVQRLRTLLQKGPTENERLLSDAKRLYDWLIRLVEPELTARDVDTLIFAPDSVFRLIPFSVLHDGSSFLIEKYAVVTIPAITLIDLEAVEPENVRALLSGLSETSRDFQEFPPLPNVKKELENIERIIGGKVLLNKEYTSRNLREEFRNHTYSLLHMSTHGEFGNTVQETFLLAYDSKIKMKEFEDLVGIGISRKIPLELLTLSACQTAVGDEQAALGLAGLALKAGAKSVIATLWSVNDESTSIVMSEFYRQVRIPNISKAKALQNAQKMLIRRPPYQSPFYWAPFLLIGNWL